MVTNNKNLKSRTADSKPSTKKPVVKSVVSTNPVRKVSSPKIAKPVSKPATARKEVKKVSISPEERHLMIATAAYYRAEQRGFNCCCEQHDWISGEAQIDALLNT